MRIAVAGGTGLVGRIVVRQAREAGHEVVVLSRTKGVDLGTGEGLREALAGVDAVVDVSNVTTLSAKESTAFFTTATEHLLTAGRDAGVWHHVALSIVGVDRVPFGYYRGKLAQEQAIAAGPVPWTVLRATQFHEFPGQLLRRVAGPVVPVPRMRSATVAAREVAQHLVRLVGAEPAGLAPALAGPEIHDMPDLVRRELRRQRRHRLVVPVKQPGETGRLMATDGLLPVGDCVRGVETFDEWVAGQSSRS